MASGFGVKLRAWRESAGLTQQEVSEALGVRQPTVSEWERDTVRLPDPSRAGELEALLGLAEGTVRRALAAAMRARLEALAAQSPRELAARVASLEDGYAALEELVADGRRDLDEITDRLEQVVRSVERRKR